MLLPSYTYPSQIYRGFAFLHWIFRNFHFWNLLFYLSASVLSWRMPYCFHIQRFPSTPPHIKWLLQSFFSLFPTITSAKRHILFSFKFSSIIIFFITKNKPDFLYDSFIQKVRLVFLVDLAGVEPASESPSIRASPITVIILTFPPCGT